MNKKIITVLIFLLFQLQLGPSNSVEPDEILNDVYGSVFYKEGVKYAGWYETTGQLVQIYDTMQESIDGEVTTLPSAIRRQGSDVSSNDPRLNIPGTPDTLT